MIDARCRAVGIRRTDVAVGCIDAHLDLHFITYCHRKCAWRDTTGFSVSPRDSSVVGCNIDCIRMAAVNPAARAWAQIT